MIESFLKYLQFEKRYSIHTVTSYQTDLLQLQSHLEKESLGTLVHQVTSLELRGWVISLLEQQLDARSVNRKIATIRSYFKFLLKREVVEEDPTTKLKSLKIKKQIPQFVSEQDMVMLLDQFKYENSYQGWRDKVVL